MTPSEIDEDVHDSTLQVTYNVSAAQVMKLVEAMEFRLRSRAQALDVLASYWEKNRSLPPFAELEILLESVTFDQIGTHFNSYLGYVKAAGLSATFADDVTSTIKGYIATYVEANRCVPSKKAIALAHMKNNLLLVTEDEICELLPEYDWDGAKENKADPVADISVKEDSFAASRDRIKAKFLNKVRTVDDIRKLTDAEKADIIRVYGSLFLFLQALSDGKKAA